jgi:hypothetical protein
MLNASIRNIPIPPRMARRPVSNKGFPVPHFVTAKDDDGNWDFRFVDARMIFGCHRRKVCWLCGEPLGQYLAFVIGPMCAINRVSSEPPSHRDCAEYAVKACPFLTRPAMRRNDADLSEEQKGLQIKQAPGIAISHNPGATLLWITKSYKVERSGNGLLFFIGEPREHFWFKEGRTATRDEVMAAIEKGLPYLRSVAAMEHGGTEALEESISRAMPLLPKE